MNDKFCYYDCEAAAQIQASVAHSIIYKKSRNFPIIKYWNKYTGSIPSTAYCADGFKKFYLSKVVDDNTLADLEDEKVINSNQTLAKLYPIITPSDGNCLCHAVSLYMWGISDRGNFLRKLLHATLLTDENKLLQRLHMQHVANQQVSEENFHTGIWNTQWDKLVNDTKDVPSNPGSTLLESLEAIHIFMLANILLRPIIVLSSPVVKTVFNHTIQSDNIGGIYLPLLCNPDDTEKSPIVLGFHMNHFTPLLYMENGSEVKGIPLKRADFVTLPVHFFQDSMPNSIAKKLKTYLTIDKRTESALIIGVPLPKAQNVFDAHIEHCNVLYGNATLPVAEERPELKGVSQTNGDEWSDYLERHSETIHIISSSMNKSPSMCINNCGMYGSAELGNKCSKCFALDPSLSDTTHQRRAEQAKELRTRYEDVAGQNANKRHLPSEIVVLSPAAENRFSPQAYRPIFQLPQRTSQDESEQNHQKERSETSLLSHFRPVEFLSSEETAILMPTPHKIDEQFEETNLETATCITSGCRGKAHRRLQYRCASCFIERQHHKPIHHESELGTVGNHSQRPEKLPEIIPEQATGGKSFDSNPINRINYSTPQTLLSTEDRQVSLLDLLCSKENCPNRRISPLHALCLFCAKKSDRLYCSTPGCSNEKEQNGHAMCNVCFQNKLQRQKIPAEHKTNAISQIFGFDSYNRNHGSRLCDKPNCINSRSVHSTGYCIQCFAFMEKQGCPHPTAPTFHN